MLITIGVALSVLAFGGNLAVPDALTASSTGRTEHWPDS